MLFFCVKGLLLNIIFNNTPIPSRYRGICEIVKSCVKRIDMELCPTVSLLTKIGLSYYFIFITTPIPVYITPLFSPYCPRLPYIYIGSRAIFNKQSPYSLI